MNIFKTTCQIQRGKRGYSKPYFNASSCLLFTVVKAVMTALVTGSTAWAGGMMQIDGSMMFMPDSQDSTNVATPITSSTPLPTMNPAVNQTTNQTKPVFDFTPPITTKTTTSTVDMTAAHGEHKMESGNILAVYVDKFEVFNSRTSNTSHFGNAFDGHVWYGGDQSRFVWESEGEVLNNRIPSSSNDFLYWQPYSAFWNTQIGARIDTHMSKTKQWLALGMQGTMPYNVDTEVTGYLGKSGGMALKFKAEQTLYMTEKLVFQPQGEVLFNNQHDSSDFADPKTAFAKPGLSEMKAGLRFRLQMEPTKAPYAGVTWTKNYANHTAEYAWVAGLSYWF